MLLEKTSKTRELVNVYDKIDFGSMMNIHRLLDKEGGMEILANVLGKLGNRMDVEDATEMNNVMSVVSDFIGPWSKSHPESSRRNMSDELIRIGRYDRRIHEAIKKNQDRSYMYHALSIPIVMSMIYQLEEMNKE